MIAATGGLRADGCFSNGAGALDPAWPAFAGYRHSRVPCLLRCHGAVFGLYSDVSARGEDQKAVTLYRDSAVVLRTWKLGESDRIVSMLGENSGKIRAVVKGVRKTKSRFGSRLEPLSLVSLLCWKGRELDVVSQAETIELFRETREDLDRLYKANVILEATEQVAQDGYPDPELFRLVVRVLRVLESDNPQMLLGSFVWKLLSLQGYRPQMTVCVMCGNKSSRAGFDFAAGGILCEEHSGGKRSSPEALDVISRSLDGQLAQVLRIENSPVVSETEVLALQALEAVLERSLRSVRSSIIRH